MRVRTPTDLLVSELASALAMERATIDMYVGLEKRAGRADVGLLLHAHAQHADRRAVAVLEVMRRRRMDVPVRGDAVNAAVIRHARHAAGHTHPALIDLVLLEGAMAVEQLAATVYDMLGSVASAQNEDAVVALAERNHASAEHARDRARVAAERIFIAGVVDVTSIAQAASPRAVVSLSGGLPAIVPLQAPSGPLAVPGSRPSLASPASRARRFTAEPVVSAASGRRKASAHVVSETERVPASAPPVSASRHVALQEDDARVTPRDWSTPGDGR